MLLRYNIWLNDMNEVIYDLVVDQTAEPRAFVIESGPYTSLHTGARSGVEAPSEILHNIVNVRPMLFPEGVRRWRLGEGTFDLEGLPGQENAIDVTQYLILYVQMRFAGPLPDHAMLILEPLEIIYYRTGWAMRIYQQGGRILCPIEGWHPLIDTQAPAPWVETGEGYMAAYGDAPAIAGFDAVAAGADLPEEGPEPERRSAWDRLKDDSTP